jgi:hypothetical protein
MVGKSTWGNEATGSKLKASIPERASPNASKVVPIGRLIKSAERFILESLYYLAITTASLVNVPAPVFSVNFIQVPIMPAAPPYSRRIAIDGFLYTRKMHR